MSYQLVSANFGAEQIYFQSSCSAEVSIVALRIRRKKKEKKEERNTFAPKRAIDPYVIYH